jgi:hypothetical protein
VFRPSAEELEEIEAQDRRRREVGYIGAVTDDLFGDHAAVYEEGSRTWLVPALYTQRHHAEEARKQVEERDPEAYLGLVAKKHGEEITNRAYDNAAPLRVVWTDRDALMDWLPDTAFPAVMVDNEFKLPGNLWGDLIAERGE